MTTLQQFCASTGRRLTATPPMAVAAQPVTFLDVAPWQRIDSPDPAAVIFVPATAVASAGAASGTGFTPNALGTCLEITPEMEPAEAVALIVDTASALQDWTNTDFVAGEGDESAGAVRSAYRYLRGTFTAEPGAMATSSLVVGWNSGGSTHLFQFLVTGWQQDLEQHDNALDCVRIGDWGIREIVEAMRA